MSEQELLAFLREPYDFYGHNRGSNHPEVHEAQRDVFAGESQEKARWRMVTEDHSGYEAKKCRECSQWFIIARGRYDLTCGGCDKVAA